MRKQWVALLSVLGLTGPVMRSESQVLKGSKAETKAATSETVKKNPAVQNPRLDLKQQTLRQQSPGGGKQADTMTPSAYCNKNQTAANNQQLTKGAKANNQLTPPPPGVNTTVNRRDNQQITKGNQQVTKGKANTQLTPPPPGANNAVTKGNNAITKGNQQITKGNQQITKGNQQITKGRQQVTKANNAITK